MLLAPCVRQNGQWNLIPTVQRVTAQDNKHIPLLISTAEICLPKVSRKEAVGYIIIAQLNRQHFNTKITEPSKYQVTSD